MRNKYTDEQLLFLKTGYMTMNVRNLTMTFNETFGTDIKHTAIHTVLNRHGFKCGRKGVDRLIIRQVLYTDEMISFFEIGYKTMDLRALTQAFNEKFGMEKSENAIHAVMGKRKITSGRTGRFKNGDPTWNAGTKGLKLTKANKGSFTKGNAPANRKPIGSERICSKEGYVLIKVNEEDPNTGSPTRYKHKHVHIYEQHYGPVPDGMVVVFKDSDILNFDPENLVLVSRSELLRMNKHRYKMVPGELKPTVLALSKLEVKMFEKCRPIGNYLNK